MIGISLLTLVPGVFGGSATYAAGLIRALARVGTLEYRVFAPTIAPDAGNGLPTKIVSSYRASRRSASRLAAMSLATVFPAPVRRDLELGLLDAIHFPLTVTIPRVDRTPTVATVHDVLHVVHPELFSRAERIYRALVYGRLTRSTRLLIVPSEYSKNVLVERLRVEPARIRVIHHGVERARLTPGPGPRGRFLLYPADGYRHKNHGRLLEAFELLRADHPDLNLVLTGFGLSDRLRRPGVEVRGRVSAAELVELYRSAAALVYPSLHETFGLPPLEAMACGCPVASSRAGSLPEICGDAARFFDPESPEEIADAVRDVLADRDELVARGRERAATFSWERSAREHEAVYRELLEQGGPGPRRP
jgi:glycosyltransferase involved in cell wall biosynthesis